MKNLPKFFYLCNFFRLAVYFSKLISIFSKKERKRTSFYNFFKKRKRYFDKDLLTVFYRPKIFIFNHDFETKDVLDNIYNYENLFEVNKFTNDGHKNVFQSVFGVTSNVGTIQFERRNNQFERRANLLRAPK